MHRLIKTYRDKSFDSYYIYTWKDLYLVIVMLHASPRRKKSYGILINLTFQVFYA